MKMEALLPIGQLVEQNRLNFEKDMQRLVETCDKYPDIAEFVLVLVNGLLADDKSEEYRVASAISTFMWKLHGVDICSGLTNSYHYRGSWLSELNSFIGNYFLDDAYFTLVRSDGGKEWEVVADNDNGIQNPLALIAAARDVVRFHQQMEMLEGKAWMRCMRKGMESSGEVERYLR